MQDTPLEIPGAFVALVPYKAYRLKRITERVRASQAVVDLLCELAFGPRDEWVPTPMQPRATALMKAPQ